MVMVILARQQKRYSPECWIYTGTFKLKFHLPLILYHSSASFSCCSFLHISLLFFSFPHTDPYDKSPAATLMLITLINQYKTCYRLWSTQWLPSIYALFAHDITIRYYFKRFSMHCIYTILQRFCGRARYSVSQKKKTNTSWLYIKKKMYPKKPHTCNCVYFALKFRSTLRKPYHFYQLDRIQ